MPHSLRRMYLLRPMPFIHISFHPSRISMKVLTYDRDGPPARATSTPPPTAARACLPPSHAPHIITTAQVRTLAHPLPGLAQVKTASGEQQSSVLGSQGHARLSRRPRPSLWQQRKSCWGNPNSEQGGVKFDSACRMLGRGISSLRCVCPREWSDLPLAASCTIQFS